MLDIVASYHCMQFHEKLEKMTKNLVLGLILAYLAQIWATNFFLTKIWLRQSLDIMDSYYHAQYQKKLMIQSWENLVMDEWPDGRTDTQTEKSDFIGGCTTNADGK